MNTTRRQLLRTSLATGAGVGLFSSFAHAQEPAIHWDQRIETLIIGTGFAGLAAAIEAHDCGAKNILVIDKMPVPGGNSAINGGDLSAAGTDVQEKMGVQDSPDLMYQDMLKAGGYLNHPKLARKIADESKANFEWCRDYLGVEFARLNYHGGHSVKRAHQTKQLSGSGIIQPMLKKLKEQGVKIQLRTKLEKFYVEDNKIIGAQVRVNYRHPDPASGSLVNIRTTKGCIIASGGFSNDVALRQIHDPRLTDQFTSTNQPGATGECLQAAMMAGAADVQMDWIQLGPWTSPDEQGFGFVPQFCERIIGYGLMVDPATGKRFFKETGNRKERADAIILIGHPVVIFGDSVNVKKMVAPSTLEKGLANGSIRSFNTLEELADFYKMPKEALLAEVKKWNGYVKAKKDPDFDCLIFEDAVENVTAPFYAARLWPRVHHTMGGLVINENAQVINNLLQPIEGLYAAGEATGGVHGMVRLGSVAGSDCICFGRQAARSLYKK